MTTKTQPYYLNRFTRTTTSEFRHLLKDGETTFHQFYARMEKEYDTWVLENFVSYPNCEPELLEDLYEQLDEDQDYIEDVESYIQRFYIPDLHIDYIRAMRFAVDLPEPLAEKVIQAAKSQGKSAEEFILEAIAKLLDLMPSITADK